jgi:hypothetical protein
MTRAWLGRTAARTYPPEIRAAHGEELIGTLLDAGEHSVALFGRELASLVAGGLAARSRKALSQPLRQISRDLVRWACIVIVARELAGNLASLRWGGTFGGSLSTVWLLYAGPALILTVFTAGRDRTTGIIGLIWLYTSIRSHPQPPISIWIEFWVPPLAAFMLMAIRPRRKAGCERALWLIPAIVWAIFQYTELGQQSGIGYLTPVLATLIFVPIAPAFALATAVAWSLMAAWYLPIGVADTTRLAVELLSCTPLALIVVVLSGRALRRT